MQAKESLYGVHKVSSGLPVDRTLDRTPTVAEAGWLVQRAVRNSSCSSRYTAIVAQGRL